ncbi:MAG: aminotransferase class I/II-fold pyridoxal phosphate-dependent enzyme [Halobacteria archaeon]
MSLRKGSLKVKSLHLGNRVARRVREVPPSGIRRFFEMVIGMEDVLSLAVGEPDFATPWRVREAAIYSLERGDTSYTSNWGLLELREAIARHMEEGYGATYDPKKEVLVTTGVSEGLDLTLRAVVEPGEEILYPEPAYVSYGPNTVFAGGVPRSVVAEEHEGFVPRAEALDAAAAKGPVKALLLNYPNNPTGAALGRREMARIAEVAEDRDLLIISDEIYRDLTYDGKPLSMASFAPERTIVLGGFSKGQAMTGFRIGYACGPAELIAGLAKIHQYTMLCAPITGQYAAIEALAAEGETREMVREYDRRRRFLMGAFREMDLPCAEPKGAFYAFPMVPGESSEKFAEGLLNQQKVAVVPGSAFGKSGEGHIRISYAVEMGTLREAVERIGKYVEGK